MISALLLGACLWKPQPSRVPFEEARGAVRLVALPAEGPATALEIAVRAGSAHDPVGKEGLAALTADLLRQGGAGARSPAEVDQLLYEMGTDVEVVVDKELVTFRASALHEDLGPLAELMADMVLRPRLDAAVATRLVSAAEDALTKGILDSDERLGMEIFDTWLYQGHPYGHPVAGRAGVVGLLGVSDVRTFLDDRYVRPAVVLGVAGAAVNASGLRPDGPGAAAIEGLRAALSTLPARLYKDVTPRATPRVEGRSLLLVEKPTASVGVHFGHPLTVDRGHPDWPALTVAFTALGEHRQSHGRLYQALREARGLNYGDYAYIERYQQAGWSALQQTGTGRVQNPFYVWLRPVQATNGAFALKGAITLVEEFVRDGLTAEEFTRIQRYLVGRLPLWAASPDRRLGWATEAALMGWPDPLATLGARVAALTREEVNAAVKRHIQPNNLRVVMVTGDAAALRAELADGVTTPLREGPAPSSPKVAAQSAGWAAQNVGFTAVHTVKAEGFFR